MISENIAEYSDGSYSATSIKFGKEEGNSLSKIMTDVKSGKVRHIGEAHCFDKDGNYQVLKNLVSDRFDDK